MTKINVITDEEKNKVVEYQIEDEWGNPLGPPQKFEAGTWKDLSEKLAAAHANSSVAMYKTKREAKLGRLLEDVDLETPLPTFEEKQLTADDRVKISQGLGDPARMAESFEALFESKFGANTAKVRQALQWIEATDRSNKARDIVYSFTIAHPEYVDCVPNRDAMEKYLTKHKMSITKKNLEIAYDALTAEDLLVIQKPKPAAAAASASASPTPALTATLAPAPQVSSPVPSPTTPSDATIPQPTIPASAITETPAPEGTPRNTTSQGSAGLSPRGASVTQTPNGPKTPEITIQQINAMTSQEYAAFLKIPGNPEKVDKLMAGKK